MVFEKDLIETIIIITRKTTSKSETNGTRHGHSVIKKYSNKSCKM